ncbi:MAG: class I SAM-dependent methyltransferase [Candidatus Marinimicrobia bacterium]|nr:class I SAM-dependent methyltransferase [Candidatus Neomarinimicrobiota bacterium]
MKIVSITHVYNEEMQIEACINNSREQGLIPIIIDNGCTDRSIDIAKDMGAIILKHFTDTFEIYGFYTWSIARAKEIGCDWYILKDTDEIFETYNGQKVRESIIEADAAGFNCMDCDLYEFWPTVDDNMNEPDFIKRINHYSYYKAPLHRIVKNIPQVWADSPHIAKGNIKLSPEHIVLRHYKFISLEQGRAKVASRRARYSQQNISAGGHTQYNYFTDDSKYYVLERDIYSKLHVYNGTWIKEQVFDGWRKKRMNNLPAGWLVEEASNYLSDAVTKVANLKGDFMEVGSFLGRSTVAMGTQIKKLKGKLWCIDTWDVDICTILAKKLPADASHKPTWKEDGTTPLDTFNTNITKAGLDKIVKPLVGVTADFITGWKKPLRLIFIDGDHSYDVTKADAQWRKFLVKGGIIAFHDYTNYTLPFVKKAIDDEMNVDADFEFIGMAQSIKAFRRK